MTSCLSSWQTWWRARYHEKITSCLCWSLALSSFLSAFSLITWSSKFLFSSSTFCTSIRIFQEISLNSTDYILRGKIETNFWWIFWRTGSGRVTHVKFDRWSVKMTGGKTHLENDVSVRDKESCGSIDIFVIWRVKRVGIFLVHHVGSKYDAIYRSENSMKIYMHDI